MSGQSPAAGRGVRARLSNVLASPASEQLKSRLIAALEECEGLSDQTGSQCGIEHVAVRALCALIGSEQTGLDFVRVVRGDEPACRFYSAALVGAALRDKAGRLRRPLTDADFSPDHHVPLFALAYWGGVAAWSATADARKQRPKGFWAHRRNQIDALRRFAAEHPGQPITAATLAANGLSALARTLDAAQLDALAAEAGIDRALLYEPSARWTAERVIDAYAALCRTAGVSLSSPALTEMGGEASSLRAYIQRHFASFAAFQQVVRARHPDIRHPKRPATEDGLVLDSWSEVVVHNALRRALPDVAIAHHVILPGETKRSADFVLDGLVWVELLGVAEADMPSASTARQRKYAAQWAAKRAIYAALGIAPVLIEPADVHDPARLGIKIAEIAARLVETPREPPPAVGLKTRGKGEWDFDFLCHAVRTESGGTGVFPTYEALTAAGYGHAANLLRRPGARARVAAALGLACRTARGAWTRERVVAELAEQVVALGAYPTGRQLSQRGRGALASARQRLWAGDQRGLRAAVEARSGVALPPRRAANGSWATMAQIEAALRPLARRLGRMPTCAEATEAGLVTAWSHASRRKGVAAAAASLGVPCGPRRRWTSKEILDSFARLSASRGGARLNVKLIRAEMGSGAIARVRRLGGIAAVRAAIERRAQEKGKMEDSGEE